MSQLSLPYSLHKDPSQLTGDPKKAATALLSVEKPTALVPHQERQTQKAIQYIKRDLSFSPTVRKIKGWYYRQSKPIKVLLCVSAALCVIGIGMAAATGIGALVMGGWAVCVAGIASTAASSFTSLTLAFTALGFTAGGATATAATTSAIVGVSALAGVTAAIAIPLNRWLNPTTRVNLSGTRRGLPSSIPPSGDSSRDSSPSSPVLASTTKSLSSESSFSIGDEASRDLVSGSSPHLQSKSPEDSLDEKHILKTPLGTSTSTTDLVDRLGGHSPTAMTSPTKLLGSLGSYSTIREKGLNEKQPTNISSVTATSPTRLFDPPCSHPITSDGTLDAKHIPTNILPETIRLPT